MKKIANFSFVQRNRRPSAPLVQSTATLPARELLEAHPAAQGQLDRFARAAQAQREHSAAAGRYLREAEQAEQLYYRTVREHMAAGQDATKVKNAAPALTAKAQQAAELAREARTQVTAAGHALGAALAEVAPEVAAAAEPSIAEAAERVAEAQALLDQAQRDYAEAFGVRVAFGALALTGGTFSVPRMRFDQIGDPATALDRLRDEEAWVRDWLAQESAATAANAQPAAG